MSTTWSPTARSVTPGPSASTTPAASWPSTTGTDGGRSPVDQAQVAVAHPAVRDPNQDLTGMGLVDDDVVVHLQRGTGCLEDGGAHGELRFRGGAARAVWATGGR